MKRVLGIAAGSLVLVFITAVGAAMFKTCSGLFYSACSVDASLSPTSNNAKALAEGEKVFWASGCASCHSNPDGNDPLVLSGGRAFETDFGVLHAPNISNDEAFGIGGWSFAQFEAAVRRGLSPDGEHYYPAFPYVAYSKMTDEDVEALWLFIKTLPSEAKPSLPQDMQFPFSVRFGLLGWKALFANDDWVMTTTASAEIERGRYLVEALAHCGDCHTPRGALGQLQINDWMAGGPNPSGRGSIPSLRSDALSWSATDIAYYLESGFTPDYDSAGGEMAHVVENFARLSDEDRQAVAAYVKALD